MIAELVKRRKSVSKKRKYFIVIGDRWVELNRTQAIRVAKPQVLESEELGLTYIYIV